MYILEIMSGPLDGKTWTFENEITIGRDDRVATACITIDRYVSRKHARLWESDGKLRIEDLASRNGTRLGGKPVNGNTDLELGEPFTVGRTMLRVTKA
ncbi:MAG: FHA domain-containing protein [Candidatus Eremiobacteraeota bacterium]|nr:FHA domain-containing protein [Candidatus Eremiobacteraeota bacterium]